MAILFPPTVMMASVDLLNAIAGIAVSAANPCHISFGWRREEKNRLPYFHLFISTLKWACTIPVGNMPYFRVRRFQIKKNNVKSEMKYGGG